MDMTAPFLDGCKEQFDKGNKWALMQAIYVCAVEKIPLPIWAAQAYEIAFKAAEKGNAKSWDDVFGKPYPSGTHLHKIVKRHAILWPLYQRAKEIVQGPPKRAVDESLFEDVAREFHIGKTLASEYYYEAKRITKLFGFEE
jgi:hypothetical protein